MRIVTTCPFCFTRFIVQQKQVEAQQGEVRCGQCQHVFNAMENSSAPAEESDSQAAFLNSATSKKNVRQKPKSKTLIFLIVLLVLSAMGQMIYFNRTNIAAHWPTTKPRLDKICQALHCRIELPKHAELISLDDTELVKDETHNNVIEFTGLLMNNAPFAQAYPVLELTLTDENNQALGRRKILPEEYLKSGLMSSELNTKEFDAGRDARISVHLETTLPVAGFKVDVIY